MTVLENLCFSVAKVSIHIYIHIIMSLSVFLSLHFCPSVSLSGCLAVCARDVTCNFMQAGQMLCYWEAVATGGRAWLEEKRKNVPRSHSWDPIPPTRPYLLLLLLPKNATEYTI